MSARAELKREGMDYILNTIKNAGEQGVSRAFLVDKLGVSPSSVTNWVTELRKDHPEISENILGNHGNYRWIPGGAELKVRKTRADAVEGALEILKKYSPKSFTSVELGEKLGVSKTTIIRGLKAVAKDHIELYVPSQGERGGYRWTPIVEPKPSDEIDPNDVEAIMAAFGQKPETTDTPEPASSPTRVCHDPYTDQSFLTSDTVVVKAANAINQKALPQFSWKEEKEKEVSMTEENANDKPGKNAEGYSDPTAAQAIKNADSRKTEREGMTGEVWAVDKQFGGEAYFAVLASTNSHAVGIQLNYENDSYPYPKESCYIYTDGGAEWVGDARRVVTKPIKVLRRKVGSLSSQELMVLRAMVNEALNLCDAASYERRIENQYNEIQALRSKVKDLTEELDTVLRSSKESDLDRIEELEKALKASEESEASYAHAVEELTATCDMANKTIAELQEKLRNQSGDDLKRLVEELEYRGAIDRATIKAYEFALKCFGKGVME